MNTMTKAIIAFFVAVAAFTVAFLLFDSIGVEDAIMNFFRKLQMFFFDGGSQSAKFHNAYTHPTQYGVELDVLIENDWDTVLVLYNTDVSPNGIFKYFSMKYMAYMPFLILVSLLLATPMPFSKKWKSVLTGLLLFFAYFLFLSSVIVRKQIYHLRENLGETLSGIIHSMDEFVFTKFVSEGFNWMVVMPVIIWFFCLLLFFDFSGFFREGERGGDQIKE